MFRVAHIAFSFFVIVFVTLTSCREHQLSSDPSALLSFSTDTINFDTVFTAQGSSTRTLHIYNRNANALSISRVWWAQGDNFFANLDGENQDSLWHDLIIYGGDSMMLFLRTEINPYGTNAHPIEHDTLFFLVNGRKQFIAVQAYGMDVERIYPKSSYSSFHFTTDRPYLIYDTLRVNGPITIDAGATLYMHHGASIHALGDVTAIGNAEQPIRILGDRTDYLFPKVPYRMASGQWDGIYLYDTIGTTPHLYDLQFIHLLSGQVGLYSMCNRITNLPTLRIHNARIHNMSMLGLVIENTNAQLSNLEISNCAGYGLMFNGGNHIMEHSTVANYFGYPYTTLNIHSSTRWDVASVYICASSNDMAPDTSSIYNSIITGAVHPALVIDSILPSGYTGQVAGCYLNCDSDSLINQPWAHDNVYAKKNDTVFVNTYYRYGEYIYYDFRLTEHSPARFIGWPIVQLPKIDKSVIDDQLGNPRNIEQPDAGCYTYLP